MGLKVLGIVWLGSLAYWLLVRASVLAVFLLGAGLGLLVGGVLVAVGIETVRREEELQR